MSYRLVLSLGALIASATFAPPRHCHAQNKGQIVQAVVKLNAAQLAVVKRLADDPTFSQQFEAATASGNYGQAITLVSAATGVDQGSISVGPRGLAAAPAEKPQSMVSLASFSEPRRLRNTATLQGKICFDFGSVKGCIEF